MWAGPLSSFETPCPIIVGPGSSGRPCKAGRERCPARGQQPAHGRLRREPMTRRARPLRGAASKGKGCRLQGTRRRAGRNASCHAALPEQDAPARRVGDETARRSVLRKLRLYCRNVNNSGRQARQGRDLRPGETSRETSLLEVQGGLVLSRLTVGRNFARDFPPARRWVLFCEDSEGVWRSAVASTR